MCGRYTRKAAADLLYAHFGIDADEEFSDLRIEPCMDAAPGSIQPVVQTDRSGARVIVPMRWGFKMKIENKNRLVFNTRAETVTESALWKKRFVETRCIVPASSFLEGPPGAKCEISVLGREIFGFAGLWGSLPNPKTGEWESAFSILTTEPNARIKPIHDRQPVILSPIEYEEWLAPGERPPLHLLRIFPEEQVTIAPLEVSQPALFGPEDMEEIR